MTPLLPYSHTPAKSAFARQANGCSGREARSSWYHLMFAESSRNRPRRLRIQPNPVTGAPRRDLLRRWVDGLMGSSTLQLLNSSTLLSRGSEAIFCEAACAGSQRSRLSVAAHL